MNESLVTGQFINARRRLILLSVFSILLTGTLVGLATTFPLYNSVRAHIEQVNIANAISQKDTIENQLERYHSLAAQFTSRTEIRKRLELFDKGEWTLEQVQEYSQPRLAEPANHIEDLAAMIRVSKNGKLIAGVGPHAAQIAQQDQNLAKDEALSLFTMANSHDATLIKVVADIYSSANKLIGHDILYFNTSALEPSFVNFGTYGARADLFLVDRKNAKSLTREQAFNQMIKINLTEQHTSALKQMSTDTADIYNFEDNALFSIIHVPFADKNWSLAIRIPQREFYASAIQDLTLALTTIILMVLLGSLLTKMAVNPFTRQLLKQAQKIDEHSVELKLAASVFEHSQEAIVITDPDMQIYRVNQGFKDVLRLEENHQPLGRLLNNYLDTSRESSESNPITTKVSIPSKGWKGEAWYFKHIDNEKLKASIPTTHSISTVKDEAGKVIYLIHIFNDISQQKADEKKMHRLAMTDSLTGLPNRSSLMKNIDIATLSCTKEGCRLCVLFIDLDSFKPINDTYGHRIGDEVLRQVASRISFQAEPQDIVGRLGGDEFLLVRKDCSKSIPIDATAQRIINHLSEPFFVDGLVLNIGASIGIAYYPEDGKDADDIVNSADQAMYQAKQAGRNRFVVFKPEKNNKS